MRRAILLLAAALAARANAGTATPPSSPPIEALHAAAAYSAAREDLLPRAGRRPGRLRGLPERGAATRPHELASGTKSFSGVMAAAAVKDGLLRLDERVVDSISEWRVDPRKAKVTVRQLLSLTSGVKTGGERGRVPTYADAVAAPLADAPGQRFSYGAVPFQVFGEVMRRKLAPRGEGPLEYLRRRVLDPIGLSAGRWRRGGRQPAPPSGAALTARDWAKLGEPARLGGRRNGVAPRPGSAGRLLRGDGGEPTLRPELVAEPADRPASRAEYSRPPAERGLLVGGARRPARPRLRGGCGRPAALREPWTFPGRREAGEGDSSCAPGRENRLLRRRFPGAPPRPAVRALIVQRDDAPYTAPSVTSEAASFTASVRTASVFATSSRLSSDFFSSRFVRFRSSWMDDTTLLWSSSEATTAFQ
ncbi:MAG: beta-lactamase family protein [Holophagales bacterium]|nr:beta-lactamase family protein [Holophagales bacterium]